MFIMIMNEAISMSDKIIVLSKRPSIIKKVYDIKFNPNLKPIERRCNEVFNDYYNKIWKDIDYE